MLFAQLTANSSSHLAKRASFRGQDSSMLVSFLQRPSHGRYYSAVIRPSAPIASLSIPELGPLVSRDQGLICFVHDVNLRSRLRASSDKSPRGPIGSSNETIDEW